MKQLPLLSLIVILLLTGKISAQTFVPFATVGYSLDGVAENTTAISTTGGAMDASDFVLYSQYYGTLYSGATVGLPNNGLIASGTRTYQLQSYTGFNVMHIFAGGADSLTAITPQAFPAISLLCFGTQGSATASVTVRFTDNTTQVFTPLTMDDWFTVASPVYSGFDRVLRTSGNPALVGGAGNPKMLGLDLTIACANQGKPIKRIIVKNNSASAHICVMAVSGMVPAYSVSGNPLICSGASSTLNANGFVSYTWQPSGSFAGSNTGTIVVSPTVNTIYTLTGTDASGCPGYTAVSVNVSSGAPVLSLTGSSQSVCLGATATITATGALAYTLSGSISNGVAFTPTVTTAYTVTGANGCGTTSLVTTVSVSPLQVSATTSSSLICSGTPATLSAVGATNYTWTPGTSTQTNYIVSPGTNTTYTLTGKTGNCIGTNTVSISTKPLPTLTITTTGTAVCIGDSVNLTVGGTALTYTWSSTNQTATSIFVAPSQPSLYTVVGTNSANCTNSAQQVVVVNPRPSISITASNFVICLGDVTNLIASGATTYTWSTSATGTTATVSPVSNSVYTVTGSYATGCSSTATTQVQVFSPTMAVSGNTALCDGGSANISASGAATYTWVNTGSNLPSLSVNPAATTVYTVNGSVSDPGSGIICVANRTVLVTVNPNPTITAVSNKTNNTICRGESAVLTASGAGAGGTYVWTGGLTTSSLSTNTVSPNGDQQYNVTGTDANGCVGSVQIQVHVVPCTGVKTIATDVRGIYVYPNPSKGAMTIRSGVATDVAVINGLGQTVRLVSLNAANDYRANVEGLIPGVYFITTPGERSASTIQKLIVTE
jgi:hypothetical protein